MKSFKVSNFRLFGRKGAEIQFKPVTVLTGTNSSGKSSFVKALVAYSDSLQSILNEYRRDGSFNPNKYYLDFSRLPALKINGFSGIKNKDAMLEESVSFARSFSPSIALHNYIIKHNFNTSASSSRDIGELHSITILQDDTIVLQITRNGNSIDVDFFNLDGPLLSDFLSFCTYCYLPYQVYETSIDAHDSSYDPRFFDDNGLFSIEKAALTDEGKLLAKLQGNDKPCFSAMHIMERIPKEVKEKHKGLFSRDLTKAIDKCLEYGTLFYFPLFEKFLNKSKETSIEIIRAECKSSELLNSYFGSHFATKFSKMVGSVIDDFANSSYSSFIEYFRSLENYALGHYNKKALKIVLGGRSYNFIEEEILTHIDVAWDSIGFNKRDEDETLFSVVYDLLSIWQWSEDTRTATDGFVENREERHDNDFFSRYLNHYYMDYSSRHILFDAYKSYISIFLTECFIPDDLSRLFYNTNSFTSVQRLHSFEENTPFVQLIYRYMYGKDDLLSAGGNYIPDSFLNKWLGKDGLQICDHLLVSSEVEGLGFSIYLVHENGMQESLADVGRGITQIVSLLIQLEDVIIQNKLHEQKNSQRRTNFKLPEAILAIEEPEVSLHPCFQSKLADILYDASCNYGQRINIIVETHSEYLIRRMQAIVSSLTIEDFENNNPFAVYYFEPDGNVYDLRFKKSGRFEESFGPGFFDESAKLKFALRANTNNYQ